MPNFSYMHIYISFVLHYNRIAKLTGVHSLDSVFIVANYLWFLSATRPGKLPSPLWNAPQANSSRTAVNGNLRLIWTVFTVNMQTHRQIGI